MKAVCERTHSTTVAIEAPVSVHVIDWGDRRLLKYGLGRRARQSGRGEELPGTSYVDNLAITPYGMQI